MSNSSETRPGQRRMEVAVLKSWDFGDWRDRYGDGTKLPYRMDHLESNGVRLRWTDAIHRKSWQDSKPGRMLQQFEGAVVPFAQTAILTSDIRRAPVTLAMFESEGNCLALWRRLWPYPKRSVLAVMTCWLAHILTSCSDHRLAAYRWAYDSIDRLYYLSSNQGSILQERLRLPADRLRYVPFGVDTETFCPSGAPDGDYLLVVGRDRGRDWSTLFDAVKGLDMPVKLCCRLSDVAGYEIPSNVEVLGYVDRVIYRNLLGRARVVAVASRPVVYPSGQSVMLEAMAMGRTVVVTKTEALNDYVRDGVNSIAVPVGDALALREMIRTASADDELRQHLGAGARWSALESFSAKAMWAAIAADLLELASYSRS